MVYRVRIDLMLPDKVDSDEVWAKLKNYLKTKKIKSLVSEKSYIEYQECHHDESPPTPCVIIERFEKESD